MDKAWLILKDGDRIQFERKKGHALMIFECCGGLRVDADVDNLYCWTPSTITLLAVLKFWWNKGFGR